MNKTDIQNILLVPEAQRETLYKVLDNAEHGSVEKVAIEDENSDADAAEKEANKGKKFYSIFVAAVGFNNIEEVIVLAPEGTHFDSFTDPEEGACYMRITFYN